MKKILHLAIIFSLAVATGYCSSAEGSYAILSSKEVDFSKEYKQQESKVIGKKSVPLIIVFPLGNTSVGALMKGAVEDAIQKSDAAYLGEVTVTSTFFYIPFIYGNIEYTVEGKAFVEK